MAWSLKCFPESFSLRSDLVRRDQSDRRVVRFYWNLAMSQQFEKCAIYVRQSRVNDSSYSSCEAQLRICMDTAASFAWRVVDHFQDSGQSSETLARPEMQRLMACVELKQFDPPRAKTSSGGPSTTLVYRLVAIDCWIWTILP